MKGGNSTEELREKVIVGSEEIWKGIEGCWRGGKGGRKEKARREKQKKTWKSHWIGKIFNSKGIIGQRFLTCSCFNKWKKGERNWMNCSNIIMTRVHGRGKERIRKSPNAKESSFQRRGWNQNYWTACSSTKVI